MVQLTRIYTRGGDQGKTSLGSGVRVPKSDARIQAIGSVDETNAFLGLARQQGVLDDVLCICQNDLFDVGADLCMPDLTQSALRITADQVAFLETQIDQLNAAIPPIQSFVLPGGSPASAAFHIVRTVARRAERDLVALMAVEEINPEVLKYINRLSDLLFVMARHANDQGAADVLWVPGAHRVKEGT